MLWLKIFLYRCIKKLLALKSEARLPHAGKCVVWPPLHTEEEIGWLNRWAAWYLPPQSQLDITVPVVADSLLSPLSPLGTPGKNGLTANVTLARWPLSERQFDFVLSHKMGIRHSLGMLWHLAGCLQTIDREFLGAEESLAFEHILRTHPTQSVAAVRTRLTECSLKNYTQLFQRYQGSGQAFVFGTGPSLRAALAFPFQGNELTIVCNSAVKDKELLAHIRPKVLTFADQVFHFGWSDYAAAFRRDALQVMREYDCPCIVPQDRALLLALHYPDIVDNFIAMPIGSQLNFPTPDSFSVGMADNIMTLLMVPVASALARVVYFLGADGRDPAERYFWRYNAQAQYTSLLSEVAAWHPAFFRDRHIGRYYQKHCERLKRQVAYGEARGIRYVSLTRSKIPVLAQRSAAEPLEVPSSLRDV